MPHHSLKHLYCSATEDYPDRGIFKSLFVSFLLQHSIPQWCPNVSVLVLGSLFLLDSHCLHACLCLSQMIQSPKKPAPWRELVTTTQARAEIAASEMGSLFPQHCQKPHLAVELHLAEDKQRRRHVGSAGLAQVLFHPGTTSPALLTLPWQQQRSPFGLIPHLVMFVLPSSPQGTDLQLMIVGPQHYQPFSVAQTVRTLQVSSYAGSSCSGWV